MSVCEIDLVILIDYENWSSKATHANHDKSPHVLKWMESGSILLEGKTEKSLWEYIS
jgi:quinol monooxygenase YgiN